MITESYCNILDNEMLPTLWHFYGMDPCYFQDDIAKGYYAVVRRQQCSLTGLIWPELRPQPYRTSLGQIGSPEIIFIVSWHVSDEILIKWGWPEDVWFHVDKLSSAHVYLRLHAGQSIDDIPTAVLEDAAQLVKANSIQGTKMNDIDVIYTMWSNLKKTEVMVEGQVGFFNDKEVRKLRVAKRINEIVNRLNKTKQEAQPDLQAEREERDRSEREDKKRLLREQKEREKEEEKRKQEEAELSIYMHWYLLLKTSSSRGCGRFWLFGDNSSRC
ncbi:hypothetical protein PR048_005520 [Dryococelus australis]|uniref:Coiled-coil domain-containing protein 25 n=1 Tax=Dryococelus australis TaxID=614101 RepID=A0ABQ9I8E7_9NEOP|nr:hypothetical protein PR048_005520 [Dryococelus australis]